ncbi:cyclic nucleotide-binding domain-containing protein [Nibribacter ruber]|uniref:Cyclic nucleotide-binding domain-containing protein n=1 Tax=Nibribacter ruber TaxID=2698458 RepID=A0A6P1NW91_9BACT|nr:Crp/Fnr family transcriptional regulator [Nibribacter ruber]QHL88106.1 cyclic nucleotide-binding domain-containing protein [Nibribacter ruber]
MPQHLLLTALQKHVSLTPEEEAVFLAICEQKEAKKKEFLLRTGEQNLYLYFVQSGCLRSFIIDQSGKEVNLEFAVERYWISDVAFHKPALLSIQALEPTQYVQINVNAFEALTQQHPVFNLFYRKLLQNGYFAFKKRMLSGMTQTAAENYRDFLLKFPDLSQRIPQYHIASYLGITPEFFSTIKSEGLDLYQQAIS